MSAADKSRRRPARRTAPVGTLQGYPGQLRSDLLRDHLLLRIGKLAPGDKLPSERALAKESGLSLLTVNKVLATLAAEGHVERRRGLGTFVPIAGKSPAWSDSRLKILRFVVRQPGQSLHSGSQMYTAQFYQGLREAAALDGIEVLPTPFAIGPCDVESLPGDAFASPNVVGLVFVEEGVPDYRPLWKFLSDGRKVVAFDFAAPERGLSSVLFDNVGGVRQAVEHCLRNGHRRLAYVGPSGNVGSPGIERLEGFRQGLTQAGLDVTDAPVILGWGDDLGRQIKALLARPVEVRPTAFVGFMDLDLVWAWEAARETGLRVPENIGLVGFGDNLIREAHPPLVMDSIAFDEVGMGRTAYELWKSGAKGLVKRQPGSLIIRGSIGPPAR
jgi:DNA-binding LacI/PurR family transcriptional regulator